MSPTFPFFQWLTGATSDEEKQNSCDQRHRRKKKRKLFIIHSANDDHDVLVTCNGWVSSTRTKWRSFFLLLFLLVIEIEMCRIVRYMRGMHAISHISDGQVQLIWKLLAWIIAWTSQKRMKREKQTPFTWFVYAQSDLWPCKWHQTTTNAHTRRWPYDGDTRNGRQRVRAVILNWKWKKNINKLIGHRYELSCVRAHFLCR